MNAPAIDTPRALNGVNLDNLHDFAAAVAADPRQGAAGFRVSTAWAGGTRTDTRVDDWSLAGEEKPRGFIIRTDEPPELLGSGVAPNPQEVLMAGLNACMMVGYVANAALMGVALESVVIETEGQLDLRGFLALDDAVNPGYDSIRYTVRIKGDGSPEQMRAIHEAVMKTSPNFHNLARPVRLQPTLVIE